MKNRYGETAYVNVSDSKEYFRFSECDKCSVKIRVQGTVHEVATWEKKHTLKNDIFVMPDYKTRHEGEVFLCDDCMNEFIVWLGVENKVWG